MAAQWYNRDACDGGDTSRGCLIQRSGSLWSVGRASIHERDLGLGRESPEIGVPPGLVTSGTVLRESHQCYRSRRSWG